MYPTRQEAEALIREAEPRNPGPWVAHSRTAAHCAEKIAQSCGLDSDKAYVLGLLHDIGRRYGVTGLHHVYDGWKYLLSLGYDEAARICLTHSFTTRKLSDYVGKNDLTAAQQVELTEAILITEYDDYDRLIQLCDAISGSDGVMDILDRMGDVRQRYGTYAQEKWDANLKLKQYFEDKAGRSIYEVTEKAAFRP